MLRSLVRALAILAIPIASADDAGPRPDILIADFEGDTYGDWKVTGESFGPGPARGTLPNQMEVTGFKGRGLVNTYHKGDDSTGTLTSPPFTIERRHINFLIGGGMHPGEACINLIVDGKTVRTATGPNDRPGGTERLDWSSWDVGDLLGKTATIEIVDRKKGGWGHINIDHIVQSEKTRAVVIVADRLYEETYRPQFHFTASANWLNDPNGLVFHEGEYHLFFQHNPKGRGWGNMTWGHAVSADLVHWKQIEHALHPDELGTIFSGSAVVDWKDTGGFQKGDEKVIVAFYTSAGGTSPESQGQPFTQSIAWSGDRGRTWTKYAKNPVLGHVAGSNRDPKVVWHEPTRKWVMALYLDGHDFALFGSKDMKAWEKLCDVPMPGASECPDFFELPVDGDPRDTRWLYWAANGLYRLGRFDGATFTPETEPLRSLWGANDYAAQTYSDIPPSDGRRIQISWMRDGRYPGMPFNQQMAFPRVLTLRKTPEGVRLFMNPIREIEAIRGKRHAWTNAELKPGENPLARLEGELWEIDVAIELGEAKEIGLDVRGQAIRYRAAEKTLGCLGNSVPLEPERGTIRLHVLVDRTSIEIFANDGRVVMASCFLADPAERSLALVAEGGAARIVSLEAWELRSVWATR